MGLTKEARSRRPPDSKSLCQEDRLNLQVQEAWGLGQKIIQALGLRYARDILGFRSQPRLFFRSSVEIECLSYAQPGSCLLCIYLTPAGIHGRLC